MSVLQAVFLGLIQGITEFLPVSSSGHLVLVQKIMGISGPSLFFDTLLHCGTLLSVIVALRADVWNLLRRPFQRMMIFLVIATAVTVAVVIFFKDRIEEAFESGQWLGQAFLVTSLALFISEYLSRRPTSFRNDAEMDWFDAVLVGFLQGIAVAPGISRSGLTLSGALSRKLNRDIAVRFSFLLAIPAILGALILQLHELYKISHYPSVNPAASEGLIAAGMAAPFIAGTLTAALVGFVAVVIMLRIVRKHSLAGFGIYTALLGLLIILDQNVFHFVF
ncbi:MAG: undecaprenyl-diphosphate phosphatase [Spirochaetaceae bacterium]|jgi:undecaprenyl-diphosphatase|nr:undecaprenyl-diphosphate phosphatase [Spirochaetaceae bacterium]